ncbi:MAG: alpha/beta hydrolase [Planctomycetes bacterium]|nr:alpha/beta hydrolase [Planctomycetota bacterium]
MPNHPDRSSFLILAVAVLFLAGWYWNASQPPIDSDYRSELDIPYRVPDAQAGELKDRCRLDLYVPVGPKDFATVVWFHGGGLTQGNKSIPRSLRGQGIAVVAPNYRLSPDAKSPEYIEDAAAAVAWTVKNIESYGGSQKKVFVAGHSAGGYLATMVGLDRRWLEVHELRADDLAGIIPFSGHSITHFTIRAERGIPDVQPIVDDMAPLYHVRRDAPPVLLITGDRERELLGRYEETAYFWRMLKVAGHTDVQLIELKGYDHGGMAEPAFPHLIDFVRTHTASR